MEYEDTMEKKVNLMLKIWEYDMCMCAHMLYLFLFKILLLLLLLFWRERASMQWGGAEGAGEKES